MKTLSKLNAENKINIFTLSFLPELEKQFEDDYFQNSLTYLRVSFFLGMIFFAAFSILDKRMTYDYQVFWFIRFAIVIPVILTVLLLSYTKNFYKYWQFITSISILIAGLSIIYMIYIGDKPVDRTYYVGFGLVLIYGSVLIKLRFIYSVVCSSLMLFVYFLMSSYSDIPDLMKFNNSFFLVSIFLNVILAGYLMEYYTRQGFLSRFQLMKEQEKMTEINLNLENKVAKRTLKISTINDELKERLNELKSAKEALIESENRFRLAFESTNSAIWSIELSTFEFYWNDIFFKLLGFHENYSTEKNIIDIIHQDDAQEFITQIENINEGKSRNIDIDIRIKDANMHWRWLHCWGKFTDNKSDNDSSIIGIAIDIHKAKTNELELKSIKNNLETVVKERTSRLSESQKALILLTEDVNDTSKQLYLVNKQLESVNKELESFSYSVSHDLKAPLRAIDGFASALLEDFFEQLDDEAKNYLIEIKENAEKMGILIKDLLEFSRLGRKPLKKKEIPLKPLFKDCCKEVEHVNTDHEISFILPELPVVMADGSMMRQVIVNLLSNAVKFSRKRDKSIVTVNCEQEDDRYLISVRDNGVGFDMEYADKLFGVFQRLHDPNEYKGYGVGLSLVKKIIVRHGGEVWANSEPGKGATFYFTIPFEKTIDNNLEIKNLVDKYRSAENE